ncbi:MAG: phosphoribosylglycinamide formyltransferase [bacterium]
MTKIRLGILASGRGSNFGAIVRAIREGRLAAEARLLVCDKPEAGALEIAREAGIQSKVIERKDFSSRDEFESAIANALKDRGVEWVALAGFMRVLHKPMLIEFAGRVLNIHPSLLPAFPGLEAQRQALEHGVKISGCTVHFVDDGVDTGPIIAQRAVEVKDDDTPETLAARILEQEHDLYWRVLQGIAEGRITSKK